MTIGKLVLLALAALTTVPLIGMSVADTRGGAQMVRLAKLVVEPAQLEAYKAALAEEIEASLRLEPGVLTLYAVSEKERPNHFTIVEIYADRAAYDKHIQTPHFLKYKTGTQQMVTSLELIDSVPLIPDMKIMSERHEQ